MHFDFCIGNPPYQEEKNNEKLYPYFYKLGIGVADCVEMIFPNAWRGILKMNGLSILNNEEIKKDNQIVFIKDEHKVFGNVLGAEWTNVVMWKKGYDNGLNGAQKIIDDKGNENIKILPINLEDIEKPAELKFLYQCVLNYGNFKSVSSITSSLRPYGLRTDVIVDKNGMLGTEKYGLSSLMIKRKNDDDIKIYCKGDIIRFASNDYCLPRETSAKNKFKVFVPYAWGNMSEKTGLGGAFANIIVALPNEICTESYLESGCFDDKKTAVKHAKYLMTKFVRALLYLNKYTRVNSASSWSAVPLQDYREDFWNGTIVEIDIALMDKYHIPNDVRNFVFANIQTKTEANIVNFKEK